MREVFDLAVVGAGPGGLAAAATAAEGGMRVCLLEDNHSLGGQIWRSSIAHKFPHPRAAPWWQELLKAVSRCDWVRGRGCTEFRLASARRDVRGTGGELRADRGLRAGALHRSPGAFLPFPDGLCPVSTGPADCRPL